MPVYKFILVVLIKVLCCIGCKAQGKLESDSTVTVLDTLGSEWIVGQIGPAKYLYLTATLDSKDHSSDSLLISLERLLTEEHPRQILFRLPAGVDRDKGLFLYFGQVELNESQEQEMLLTDDPLMFQYNSCDESYCEVRLIDSDKVKEGIDLRDLLGMFLQYDAVFFIISYPGEQVLSTKIVLPGFKRRMEEFLDKGTEGVVQELEKE